MSGSGTKPVTADPAIRGLRLPSAQKSNLSTIDFPVIGIGASAGGLEACTKLLEAFRAPKGMAFILVQHLDPTHESFMAELLSKHTLLIVREAADGMLVERDHLYIIPPASFLTLRDGALRLKPTLAAQGARLPFDVFLHSMAQECGEHAICVVLSGTGTDGSKGLIAVRDHGGFVIAQDPSEAEYDGMPRSAIETSAVDAVLSVAQMPDAILHRVPHAGQKASEKLAVKGTDRLPEIVELLRTRTPHDFTLYKPGTLNRRVERRMAMAAIDANDGDRYITILKRDSAEIDQLAKDLLIHVTGFFRDPAVFEVLANTVVPGLIASCPTDNTLRIWVAGCSTGEEAYSLGIVFAERIAAAKSNVKLQIFASDADSDAVACAREGLYSAAVVADLSPARLTEFFVKEDQRYRVRPELRGAVVFTVQDLLADPPFSRIDLVSCRNVMIYLSLEAQRKIISLFHFALNEDGVLLLGTSESVGDAAGRFRVISKPARLYRHVGHSRPGEVDFAKTASKATHAPTSAVRVVAPSRQAALAAFCQRHALDNHAPATVLINRKHDCLYSLGPTERYLRMAPGHATLDVLAMVHENVRTRLRSAILRAVQDNATVIVSGGRTIHGGKSVPFNIEVHPAENDGEELLLIYFVDKPEQAVAPAATSTNNQRLAERVMELERELKTTKVELDGTVRSLEISADEQKSINQSALSANEEFQSTNEELLTSKEELQSLNEELTALNSQLQETLEHQRTTSNDLQNVLYSTDVATLFLDRELKIRFFTPATKALFHVINTDIGRPLEDLHSLATDEALPADALTVLETLAPIECEIETPVGVWCRRILPYRTHDDAVEGVVITFTDITQRRQTARALETAKRDAEQANSAKSRFLAAASHDLRQPLQTLSLLQGILARRVEGTTSEKLVATLEDTVGSMSSMLNTLLDINQIEAGIVRAEIVSFKMDELLGRLREAFTYQAQAQGVRLRVMPCALWVNSDRRLLKQMLRNLVSNALKYTKTGTVLLGCRRHGGMLLIEVWDTGIGIADNQLKAIFEEYHQLDNAARERNRGLGLGLSIVQRLGVLLDHRVRVRSRPGKGSVFSIEVPISSGSISAAAQYAEENSSDHHRQSLSIDGSRRVGRILVVEDDPEVRELLTLILSEDGHHADAVPDGPAALKMAAVIRPDLVLTDYNLPNGMDGLEVAVKLRATIGSKLPVVVLTGDVSTQALSAIAAQSCRHLSKPVKPAELAQTLQELLPSLKTMGARLDREMSFVRDLEVATVFVVDDDRNIRDIVRAVLQEDERKVQDFGSGEAFLAAYRPGSKGCLLIDAYLPGIGGLELLQRLRAGGDLLPAIMMTGSSDVSMAVQAMKAGAADFIEKPIAALELLASIDRALERSRDSSKLIAWQDSAAEHIGDLTPRQHQIMDLVLAGHPSKNIAADLGISQRTVENHRASIMKTTGTKSLPALARLALAAAVSSENKPNATRKSVGVPTSACE